MLRFKCSDLCTTNCVIELEPDDYLNNTPTRCVFTGYRINWVPVDESIQPKDSLDIAMGIPLDKKARRHRLRYKNVS